MYSFIYLASKSPRRQELLKQIAIPFKLLEQDTDEQPLTNEKAQAFVNRLANDKALNSYQILHKKQLELAPVLGSDTIVVIENNGNEKILGKPANKNNAMEMLRLLSGQTHQVLTAICLTDGKKTVSSISSSTVSFKKLSTIEMNNYWQTGEPVDKAGAYAIQGKAASFITNISGSYSGIMGLPLYELSSLLQQFELSFSLPINNQ
ncbi:MAG: Maf family protein [Pseudomonadota bacterium]